MNENVQHYLGYLDKEMSIMGILSTFCLAIPALLIERVLSIDQNSIAGNFVKEVWSNGYTFIITALLLLLIAAMLYFKQRSHLAWYYGQIALETAFPEQTEYRLKQWLKDADSWKAWIPYNTAFWISLTAAAEFTLALISVYVSIIQHCLFTYSLIPIIILIPLLLWVIRNSIKFKDEKKLPYFRIR